MSIELSPDEIDVALAITTIRKSYLYKRNQLTEALGREPTSEEIYMIAKSEIGIINSLYQMLELQGISTSSSRTVIPASLLVQTFLTKILQSGILSSSTEENNHDASNT